MFTKLLKFLMLIIAGIFLINNPIIINESYEWGYNQIINIRQNLAERSGENNPINRTNKTTNDVFNQESSPESTTSDAVVRWPRKDIHVYYDLNSNVISEYEPVWRTAVSNWNKIGVVELNSVERKDQADIVLQVDNRSNTNQAGVTQNRYMTNFLNNNRTIIRSTAKINRFYLDTYSFDGKVNTAEHELGHALGLQHDDNHNSVMNSSGSQFPIQQIDINQLKKLYD